MNDHQDIAEREPGRWEKMTSLLDEITDLEKEVQDMTQKDEDLLFNYEEAQQSLEDAEEELKEESNSMDVNDEEYEGMVINLGDSSDEGSSKHNR